MGRVMVGIDGSAGARVALAHAAEEARLRDAVLEVVYVHALPPPSSPFSHGLAAEVASGDLYAQMVEHDREGQEEQEDQARRFGERLLAREIDAVDTTGVTVDPTLLFDRRPARRLMEAVGNRDDVTLLVVGSRGRGELTGMLLGSVSQACVANAGVPVTVVPPDGRRRSARKRA